MSSDDTTTDPDLAMVREKQREYEKLEEQAKRDPFPFIPKLRLAKALGESIATYRGYYRERVNRG